MKSITKPSVMARFSVAQEKWSDYGRIIVSFNVVNNANFVDAPEFSHYDFEIPRSLHGLSDLMVESLVGKEDVLNKGPVNSHFAYGLSLEANNPRLDCKFDTAIKAGKRVQKKLNALVEREGYANNFSDYLKYLFRVMNVKYITHETYSGEHYKTRWMTYKIGDVDQIIERCTDEIIELAHWQIDIQKKAA